MQHWALSQDPCFWHTTSSPNSNLNYSLGFHLLRKYVHKVWDLRNTLPLPILRPIIIQKRVYFIFYITFILNLSVIQYRRATPAMKKINLILPRVDTHLLPNSKDLQLPFSGLENPDTMSNFNLYVLAKGIHIFWHSEYWRWHLPSCHQSEPFSTQQNPIFSVFKFKIPSPNSYF